MAAPTVDDSAKQIKCEACPSYHNGEYGSGRFCSAFCARCFSTRARRREISSRVSATLKAKGFRPVKPFVWPKGTPRGAVYQPEIGEPHRDAYRHLTSHQKGRLAEIYFEAECIRRGIDVCVPTVPSRYDFVVLMNGEFKRAQIKWSNGILKRGCVEVSFARPRGNRQKRRSKRVALYSAKEIDLIFAYLPIISGFVVFGPRDFDGRSGVRVRVRDPLKSGGSAPHRTAEDHSWDNMIKVS